MLDQVEALFARARTDAALDAQLRQRGTVFFLHLLGLDTTGHTYRPHSREYVGNLVVVDAIARRVEALLDDFYTHDGRTAYVFSADHGMSSKGNHGDGDADNTRTPLVAWGAGVRAARPADPKQDAHRQEEAARDPAYYSDWATDGVHRLDVDQADITPLMATLLGVPMPANSEGRLPYEFLSIRLEHAMRAMLANALEVLEMYRVKHGECSCGLLLCK